MSIKGKVKMMFRCSGKSLDNLAVHRGTSVPVVRNLLARGQSRLKPFLEICTYCGYKVTLENKDLGITIPLTLEDITEDEKRRHELDDLRMKTVEVAQNVIDKQMRVAHEIASLLGETTAETKIALNKLKEVVMEEGE